MTLMTIHSAKGLEFPIVYVVGMEEGIFPGASAQFEEEEMEEERRLCYVAMTRAKERLTLTNARHRMLYGRTSANKVSRFLEEIPEKNLNWQGKDAGAGIGTGSGGARFGGYSRGLSGGYPVTSYRATGSRETPVQRMTGASLSSPAPVLDLDDGDRVEHRTYGIGKVLAVLPPDERGNVEVHIEFENSGIKKMMLKQAGQFMKKLEEDE